MPVGKERDLMVDVTGRKFLGIFTILMKYEKFPSLCWWCMPIIPSIWETEAGRFQVQGKPKQIE
jgi:hypothetical protein